MARFRLSLTLSPPPECALARRDHAVLISAGRPWEARAAKPGPRMQELRADPIVEPDAARDLLHIGGHLFRHKSATSLMKSDLGREKGIGCILMSSAVRRGYRGSGLVEIEREVDLRP